MGHYKDDRLRAAARDKTNLLETSLHDLGSVVDGEDDIGDAHLGEGSNLVLNNGLVGKLNQRLGQSEGLSGGAMAR